MSQLLEVVINDDDPEAMLDGLLQSVVCTDLVGWRLEARKLVIVFTDQLYHIAGDGLVSESIGRRLKVLLNLFVCLFVCFKGSTAS